MRRYNPREIEPKWQKIWDETGIYKTNMQLTADKHYIIPMLPYPSGDLHIGHWYNFAPTDTVARFRRMLGQNVFQTIGFDAFGLPAENAAIKRDIQPALWTHSNIATMTKQIQQIGAGYDWEHSLATCDPEYYRWNQWLFLKLYEKSLAYRAKSVVNWCPKDQTVLANEQVVGEDNICERCGTPVVQKEMESWYFRITDYVDRLLDDLETVDWPEKVKTMQANWIGKSQGALIKFAVEGSDKKIEVFTTRPDTIYGATYMVLAPEHPLVKQIVSDECRPRVEQYIEETKRKTELERKEAEKHKTGSFTGAYTLNPATKEKIPIWIADYVLASYGTGAIMAVPAHDERDYEFARKFDLTIKPVVAQLFGRMLPEAKEVEGVVVIGYDPSTDKYLSLDNGGEAWLVGGGRNDSESFKETAIRELGEEAGYHEFKNLVNLGDPIYSYYYNPLKKRNTRSLCYNYLVILDSVRQGTTHHEAHEKFKIIWTDFETLYAGIEQTNKKRGAEHWLEALSRARDAVNTIKVKKEYSPAMYAGEGLLVNSDEYDGMSTADAREKIVADLTARKMAREQTNYKLRDWLISRQRYWGTPIPIIYCDKCGAQPVPEADLPVILPEDVEFELSGRSPLMDRKDFVNTNCPKCGGPAKRETDTMDTFVDSSWYFLRYLDNKNHEAIFDIDLINKWMPLDHYIGGIEHAILHLLYARFVTKFLHDYHGLTVEEPFKRLTNQGIILGPDGYKMSKSKGNVVNPDEQVTSYGTDSLRLYLMFMGPYDQGGPYNLTGIAGTRRFLDRYWVLVEEFIAAGDESGERDLELKAMTHKTIKKVTQDLEKLGFNTAIATMMSMVNQLHKTMADAGICQSEGWRFALETLTQLLAPFAPHITEEVWENLEHESSVHISPWPQWDEKLVAAETITLAVQVNGKVRAEVVVSADISETDAIEAAKADSKIAEQIGSQEIKKAIYVPGRLVSLVV
jgi:leucyl-tRNA synthetase